MKKTQISILLGLCAIVMFLYGCRKKTVPVIKTEAITEITTTSAKTGGLVTDDGGELIDAQGVCWSTSASPTISDKTVPDMTGETLFTSAITGLAEGVTYYVRAYATNAIGTGYGNELTFTTVSVNPPCNPAKNSLVYNYLTQNYNTYAGTGNVTYGNYSIVGNGSQSTLEIEFQQEPETGLYTTAGATSFFAPGECVVHGIFGVGLGYHYLGHYGETIYVRKNGPGLYSVTFCDLCFSSGSISYTFCTDGNLTTE